MNYTFVGTRRVHFRNDGQGDQTLLFSSSLGSSLAMWDAQARQLSEDFRVLRYDHPGHGQSDPAGDAHDATQFIADVLAVMDAAGVEKVHFVGLSLGGMVGQLLACQNPERLSSLTLCATAGRLSPPEAWEDRASIALEQGLTPLVGVSRERWFTPGFVQQFPEVVEASLTDLARTHPPSYAACCRFIRDFDIRDQVQRLTTPTLMIAGQQDPATPPTLLEQLHQNVPGSRLAVIQPAAHMLNIERATEVSSLIHGFARANAPEPARKLHLKQSELAKPAG